MKEYLSYTSAAKLWDIPYIENVLGKIISVTDQDHITVPEHSSRFRINGKMAHSCELYMPTGAVVTKKGKLVASPELLFLELASELSIHRLILLGLQLCSYPPGFPNKAITTKQNLDMFLAKTDGHRGQRKAMRAMKYVQNGSASIMESLAYMILALPYALGGYGLYGAVFNYEITLNSEGKKRLGRKICFTDLFYKHANLAVEYDSFAYHSTPSAQGKDDIRSAVLERQGIKVMHMSTIQLYKKDACWDFAHNLAARLGKRIRVRSKRFDEMQSLMRELLPERKPEIET